jgi:hypothetical protein
MSNTLHLDVDPNDPRNLEKGQKLASLNEDPEAPKTPVAVSKVRGENFTQHLGRDPNDPRVVAELEDVSLPALGKGEDAPE